MGRATLVVPSCNGRVVAARICVYASARIGGHITFQILWRRHFRYMGWVTTTYQYAPFTEARGSSPVQPYLPTSEALAQLFDEAPQDYVSLGWLLNRLAKRSFGLGMLLLALVGLAPGLSIFVGILLTFPAIQMILGHERPTLPRFLASRRISTAQIARLAARIIPLFARMEALIHPRLRTPLLATKRLVGLVVLLLAATLIWPFPFSQIIPALVIMLVSFAYLEEDGVLLCVSLAAALLSLSITAGTVWATVQATGLIERLWIGS
jgi:hypothetical protein